MIGNMFSKKNMNIMLPADCANSRSRFSAYLDGDMTGVEMQALAAHLHVCPECHTEFTAWREIQSTLGAMGTAKAPINLQARLRSAIADERAKGSHLPLTQQVARTWKSMAPMAMRYAAGTAATLLLVGGTSIFLFGSPMAVEANDEPLGAMTAPHYLYSELPPQPINMGRELPILVEARIDNSGRVYDYKIVSGPMDPDVETQVQANLLASVFRPATVFGVPVSGTVILTYSGISVRG